MIASQLTKPTLVTRPDELHTLAQSLAKEPIIAVDTESNSLHAYQEQVCLVQFSTPTQDYLVDPLALPDLSPLGPIFANPDIEKVFHAAEYDILCLQRDFGFRFANLFDTMIAARTLGWEKIGLGPILENLFNVTLNKKYQRANWGERPLSADLLNYARFDTHYLIPLRSHLKPELKKNGRWPIAAEDFDRLCLFTPTPVPENGLMCWRVNGSYDLTPPEAAILQQLCLYRDTMARRLDRPWFKVIGDSTLIHIARSAPRSEEDLRSVPGMSPSQRQRHAQGLLAAVRRGSQSPPLRPPKTQRPDQDYLARLEALRTWRKHTAEKMKVDSGVVLPKEVMVEIVQSNPTTPAALAELMQSIPWRLEHFGAEIHAALHNHKTS